MQTVRRLFQRMLTKEVKERVVLRLGNVVLVSPQTADDYERTLTGDKLRAAGIEIIPDYCMPTWASKRVWRWQKS